MRDVQGSDRLATRGLKGDSMAVGLVNPLDLYARNHIKLLCASKSADVVPCGISSQLHNLAACVIFKEERRTLNRSLQIIQCAWTQHLELRWLKRSSVFKRIRKDYESVEETQIPRHCLYRIIALNYLHHRHTAIWKPETSALWKSVWNFHLHGWKPPKTS